MVMGRRSRALGPGIDVCRETLVGMVAVMRAFSSHHLIARVLLSAVLVSLVMALGACGSDNDSSAVDAEGVTRVGYIAEVNALCQKVVEETQSDNRKLQALLDAQGTYRGRLVKGASLLRENYESQRSKFDRFKRIEPPDADRHRVAEVIEASELTLQRLEQSLPAAERGDLRSFLDRMTDAGGALAYLDYLGTAYGFDENCFRVRVTFRARAAAARTEAVQQAAPGR